jgi:hypothetical protein
MKPLNDETSIHELYDMDLLSVRTFNFCKYSDLICLKDIVEYYKKHNSFKKIRNCGQKSDDELMDLCNKYLNENYTTFKVGTLRKENNTQIQQLLDRELISVRAYNLCKYAGMDSLDKIVDFYKKHGSFKKIRTCGEKSNNELIALCKNHMLSSVTFSETPKESELVVYSELNAYKKSILNKQIDYILTNLTVRSKSGMTSISATLNPKEIIETIFENGFHFNKYRNIGAGTVVELSEFKADISRFMSFLNSITDEELSKEYVKLILKTNFVGLSKNLEKILEQAFDSNGKIKLFYLIGILIETEHLFNKNEKAIFIQKYSNQCPESTLSETGAKLGLTKERVRQIYSKIEEEFDVYLKFIKNFDVEDIVNYEFNNVSNLLIIDDSFSRKINFNEGVNFNSTFYSLVLHLYLNKSHSLLGDNETINGKRKSTKTKNYKFYYFIPNSVFEIFDFALFIENIYFKLNEKLSETYSLYFEGFLFEFLKNNTEKNLNEIKETCEIILLNEFDIIIDSAGYLTFEKNKRKPMLEYVIEFLELSGKPIKVKDLLKKLNDETEDIHTTETSLRTLLNREKGVFINIRSNNTYGLRKWGNEEDSLKGATIKDLVFEYLELHEKPLHISEIVNHIKKYKDTNEKSIMTNLETGKNNRFQFFNGEFVGLKKKTYPLAILNYKKLVGVHFRISTLKTMNGWKIDDVINYYVKNFDYLPVQIKSLLNKKVESNFLIITNDNKLMVHE